MKKIVITGPESTGKSTLSEGLAKHYNTLWVAEYAREYLTALGRQYNFRDMDIMARGQIALEDRTMAACTQPLLIVDTDLITYKIWYLDKMKAPPEWLEHEIIKRPYTHYLLCCADLPWEEDPLRENPGRGDYFMSWYEKELRHYGKKYTLIKGSSEERLRLAISTIDNLV